MRMGGPEIRLGSQEARAHVLGPHSRQKGALQGLCSPVLRSPQPGFCVESREGWGWPVLPARTARHLREVREARLLALGGSPVPRRGQCQGRPCRACWPGCPGAQWGLWRRDPICWAALLEQVGWKPGPGALSPSCSWLGRDGHAIVLGLGSYLVERGQVLVSLKLSGMLPGLPEFPVTDSMPVISWTSQPEGTSKGPARWTHPGRSPGGGQRPAGGQGWVALLQQHPPLRRK